MFFCKEKQRKVTSIKGSRDEGKAIFVNDSRAERENNASMNANGELLVASDVSSMTLFMVSRAEINYHRAHRLPYRFLCLLDFSFEMM